MKRKRYGLNEDLSYAEDFNVMLSTTGPTANGDLGFFGTMARAVDPYDAWQRATAAVGVATRGTKEGVELFLDSKQGRHFADDVLNELAAGLGSVSLQEAIDRTIDTWKSRPIGSWIEKREGIPRELPYLTGFVAFYDIEIENLNDPSLVKGRDF
ncbi:hypothetical protein [Caenispirillum salinarum]|uniref:hypothetical protein n=1 Tax=Caenispirillum salinarum TaxID=859058 RepID=UPI000692176D|nr:hypothetical protein [Caenispirillum salinarum]